MNARLDNLVVARRMVVVLLGVSMLLGTGCIAIHPQGVRLALSKAGDNRSELKQVLRHYRDETDPQKLEAARFLIANMEGHGYTLTALYDEEKNEIEFDALDYADFAEAQAALDALEKEHGELDFKRKRFDDDLETITAAYLIEDIDLAFKTWRENPWARNLSFEAFCEHILPYRGSNEPINSWRRTCMKRCADLAGRMRDPTDSQEAARLIRQEADVWVRFDEVYSLHPTDQGFDEMTKTGQGRCEDMTNMMMYAMRANAIAAASDYTPYWADRDNNHAWQVILDEKGRGKAGLHSRAAKIYRKTYSIRHDSLAFRKGKDEKVPRWLSGKNYVDVTSQYMDTTDVVVRLEVETPEDARFAYLCVFNGGEWKPIQWGEVDGDHVTFTKMGRQIAYLPAYYVDEKIEPAAPPLILTSEGQMRLLNGDSDSPLEIEIAAVTPETRDADTRTTRPVIAVKPGKTYELFVWDKEWVSLGKQVAGEQPVVFDSVPSGRLYWLVEEDSRRLERIFTIEAGRQMWW